MMKKRFFDVGLYLDGLRQLRIIGVMMFVILELEAILMPLGQYINILQRQGNGDLFYAGIGVVNFSGMHPLLLLSFTVFAPVMVLYLFSFLNKRSSSDFYHALPNTRVSLFFSFFAAVITWVTAACVISSMTSVAGYLMLSQFCTVNFTSVWVMLFNTLAASLYTAAAVAVGMCLSGTTFTNLVVSLLLIFMPRVLILIFTSYLSNVLNILSPEHFIPPLDSQYNVATNLVLGVFVGGADRSLTFFTGGLYTLGVGLVYTFLAALLFRARKSEAAARSAPNRALQTVYRCLLAFIVCLLPAVFIVENIINRRAPDADDVFLYLVLYLAAVLVYLIYELITTRKWRNLVRSLPALGILALCNLGLIGGMVGAYNSVLSFHPSPDAIEYVRLLGSGSRTSSNYFSLKVAEARLDDPAILEVVANRLRIQTERIRKHPSAGQGYWSYDQEPISYETVAINTGMRTVYRRLPLTQEDNQVIAESFANNEEVRRAYTTLPQVGKNATSVGISGLSGEQAREVYEVFQEEMEAMDFTEWYAYLQTYSQTGPYDYAYPEQGGWGDGRYPATLSISTSIGTSSAYLRLPLTNLFPRSVNLYLRYAGEGQDVAEALRRIRVQEWRYDDYLQLSAYNLPGEADKTVNPDFYYGGGELAALQEELQALAEALLKGSGEAPVMEKPLLYVQFYETDPATGTVARYRGWVNVPDEAMPLLIRVLQGPYWEGETSPTVTPTVAPAVTAAA